MAEIIILSIAVVLAFGFAMLLLALNIGLVYWAAKAIYGMFFFKKDLPHNGWQV